MTLVQRKKLTVTFSTVYTSILDLSKFEIPDSHLKNISCEYELLREEIASRGGGNLEEQKK